MRLLNTAIALATTAGLATDVTARTVVFTPEVKTTAGTVRGTTSGDSRVRIFRGIPYAAPPVGELRWKAPQPVAAWTGVRDATRFGARCMQGRIFDDMIFRDEVGEDCLYLNVWMPAAAGEKPLPVMFWIHGGGFQAGSASEPRQDGERMAGKGVVVVSLNYRLGVFGFLAHPELTKESDRRASGNYGMLDIVAALRWVKDNVAAFGGDPGNVTIFGESAGSLAVSALIASPLANGLFHKAIGESGAYFSGPSHGLPLLSLTTSEERGTRFATTLGADSLAALRAKPAQAVLDEAIKVQPWFAPTVDGSFLTEDPYTTYTSGRQASVPMLAGWNADESRGGVILAKVKPSAQKFIEQIRERFGEHADALLKFYPASSDAEALESAAALATDMFMGYSTWKWIEVHAQTGRAPVYRYSFDRKIPVAPDTTVNGQVATAKDIGARHAGEIEYVFGALDSVPKVTWEASDRALSETMMSYWTNFARSGDPNGDGLPKWPRYDPATSRVMHLDEKSGETADARRPRYELVDAIMTKLRAQQAAGTGAR